MEVTTDAFLAISQVPDSIITEEQIKSCKYIGENNVLLDKKYSDEKEKLKSLTSISYDITEGLNFVISKSNLCVFRFEDVIFNLYPHIASMRRKGMTIREIF